MAIKVFAPNIHSKYKINWKKILPQAEEEISNLFLKNYNFDRVLMIEEVDEWERLSNNFKILATKNNHQVTVLLRKHIQLKDLKSIKALDKILLYLQSRGLNVPKVIPIKKNKLFFKNQGYYFQLYEFIQGAHFKGTTKQLIKIAGFIAKLHKIFEKVPFTKEISKKPSVLPPWDFKIWQSLLQISKNRKEKLDKVIQSNEFFILRECQVVKDKISSMSQPKVQVIRGDLHPHDTIFVGNDLNALIDFEGVRVGELIRDVGNACHRFVRQYVVYQKNDWRLTLPKGIKIFLSNYVKFNPISPEEIKLIPIFIKDEILRKLHKDISLYYYNDYPANLEGGELEKKLTLLKEASLIEKYI